MRRRRASGVRLPAIRGDRGKLRVHVDRVVSLEGVGDARRALEAGETMGRVVMLI
ncbi:zinc-binding dehydrogenase [Rhizobium leguminosarum]|nr:zinc-binding dehydrogenase [Rhizobium leguminosarum]NEJ82432.1 zinc-binding dehydrogenase [Rhizobium leguminosarum]